MNLAKYISLCSNQVQNAVLIFKTNWQVSFSSLSNQSGRPELLLKSETGDPINN